MRPVDQLTISSQVKISDAIVALNNSDSLILLIVEDGGKLKRTITDGDLRRLIIDTGSLDASIQNLPDIVSIVASASTPIAEVSNLMYTHGITHVPVIDDFGCPIGIYLKEDVDDKILLSAPHMGGEEQDFVKQAFDTNWIAPLGPNVDAFEREISHLIGGSHVAAVNTGTAAIHLALILLGVSRDDFVFCQSFTFVASANPILYLNAVPVFIDSEPKTWNMCPRALEKALKQFKKNNLMPKAVIVANLYGQSSDMDAILKVCDDFKVPIVEDAAESMGAMYKGKHTGTFGKFGIFSFNGNKIITTSGGGALISEDESLIKKARFLSTQAKDAAPHYEHTEIGYNYRMSNILAGVGRGQLKVLVSRVKSRRKVFEFYKDNLSKIEAIEWMPEAANSYSNRWLSVFVLNPHKSKVKAKELIDALSNLNIEARHVWKPMHNQPLFCGSEYFSCAEESYCDYLFENGVCLPSSSNITLAQQVTVIKAIVDILT